MSVSDLGDAVLTLVEVISPCGILCPHGLVPTGFVEPHVVHNENTFVYSTGQELFKGRQERPRDQKPTYPNLFEGGSIKISPSDCDGYYRNMLKYNRRGYPGDEIYE
ncbi:hypothetical protein RF11_04473 [Thelohanellus kitauei]|uniref:Uncharacterized protein n=1 Tax=Thelohanellus kitauei TaxID=669202 RepID=A0A0C2JTL5_THEKT|nr:hypothetical protein RF11_04473 [Thelohanellus kitauei]